MVKLNKLYTRNGDTGKTQLVGGTEVSKQNTRVCAYGEVDELNAVLGWCRTLAESKSPELASQIGSLQNQLFDIGAELASPDGKVATGMAVVETKAVEGLEHWIDSITSTLPELRSFVLPGGTELNAAFHLARTVCRRAERSVVALKDSEYVRDQVVIYLNRLSDLLFALARADCAQAGVEEYLWVPGKG